jgi:hypothetical protein
MTSKPPGWPRLWDWFDAEEILKDIKLMETTPDKKELLQAAQNAVTLQLEPARFISEYLRDDGSGRSPPAYKGILFGFNDAKMKGWSASCGPADAPSRYAIALSGVTFLQHLLTLDRLLSVPGLLPSETSYELPTPKKVQFVLAANGGYHTLFEGSPKTTNSFAQNDKRASLARQLLVYCVFFLFLHELSHIEAGHLDYRAERMKERKYWPLRQIRETRALESRTMEYLADSHAILRGTEMVVSALAAKPRESIILHLQQFGVGVGLNLLLTDIAENAGAAVSETALKDHPSGISRLIWCAYLVSDEGLFKEMWPETLAGDTPSKDAGKAVTDGIWQVVSAWDTLGWARGEYNLDDPAFGPPMSELSTKLVRPNGFERPVST